MDVIKLIMEYEFLRNAYLVGVIVGIILPTTGMFVVPRNKSMSIMSMSYVSVTGVTFSIFLAKKGIAYITPLYMAIIFSIVSGILLEGLTKKIKNLEDVGIPIIISGSTAMMMIFISLSNGFNQDVKAYLFGDILTTTKYEVNVLFIIGTVIIVGVIKNYDKYVAFIIDPKYCKFSNINVVRKKYLFVIILSVVVGISVKAVGMMLVTALVVLPVASASKICRSFKKTYIVSILISEICMILGLTMSYYLDLPSSAVVIIINLIVFIISLKVGGIDA